MGIEPNDHIYSALFNACANSPWPEDGLRRAKLLLEDIAVKNISLNSVTYNTIVKAFAFCGDARTAFLIADKHTSVEKLDSDAFSHVLMAAIADKEAGFWHAVQVSRKVTTNIKLTNFNLSKASDLKPNFNLSQFWVEKPKSNFVFKKTKFGTVYFFFNSPCQRHCELLPSLGVRRLSSVIFSHFDLLL